MAFPNYFPTGYNPMGNYNPYQVGQYQQMQSTQQAQTGGLQWVQGEAGAKAYPVNAGQSVLLMDSENNVFYIKSTDNSGMPLPLRTFDYKERTEQSAPKAAQNAPQTAIDTSLSYNRGNSERMYRNGESYEGGSYARGRGRNAKRDSMGRYSSERGYSYDDAKSEMIENLREVMESAPDETAKREVKKLVEKMEQM